jgi:hypothetical protein
MHRVHWAGQGSSRQQPIGGNVEVAPALGARLSNSTDRYRSPLRLMRLALYNSGLTEPSLTTRTGGNVTRPRAADDFVTIRARMHELRRENTARPRAADDFPTIRARIEDLRRERTGHLRHQSRGRFPRGPIITRAPDRRTASRGVCLTR